MRSGSEATRRLVHDGDVATEVNLVPVDYLRRQIRLGVEVDNVWVCQAEAKALNFAKVLAGGFGDETVDLVLCHLRLLLETEKTPPRAGQRENHTAP